MSATAELPPSSKQAKFNDEDEAVVATSTAKPTEQVTSPSSLDTTITSKQSGDNDVVNPEPELSKNARKKAAKLALYHQTKLIKRRAEREKCKQRRATAVAAGLPPTGPSRKALKNNTRAASTNRQRICVDLDFDGLMAEKDVCKCAKQLLWVYTINRKAPAPAQLAFAAMREGTLMQQTMQRNDGYRNWDIDISAKRYDEQYASGEIVYLTSDSDTVLEQLNVDDVYVIGGLVDHNHHKGLTLERAMKRGVRTARLPLVDHVEMKTRTVLTIVHVFDILLRVSMGETWKEAFMGVLPSRKGAVAKVNQQDSNEDESKPEREPIIADGVLNDNDRSSVKDRESDLDKKQQDTPQ